MGGEYRDLFVSARDGLRLYARDYGPDTGNALPVVCLPGLTRNAEDFHDLALALSQDKVHPRRVLAIDYRGRGRSEWDRDWRNYDARVETDDVLQILTAAGIERAVFIGTSRGGLIAMALAASRPPLLAGAVLNDVGPVLEAKGLIRIRSYVGKMPRPSSFGEAADLLRQMSSAQFPRYTDEQWLKQARVTWREREGSLVLSYDPALAKTLEALDLETALPDAWPLFEGLSNIPVLAIRGALSDLLSAQTLKAMQERHPRLTAVTVPDQGHAPALEGDLIDTIRTFVQQAEALQAKPAPAS